MILSHASNVTGALQPVAQVSQQLASRETFLLIDASQTVGQLPIDVRNLGIDLLAATCYKALGGMPGTAFTFASERCADHLKVPWVGGTGSASHQLSGPWDWTEAAESGVPNTAAWVSVDAALDWLDSQGIETLRANAKERTGRLLDTIRLMPSWHPIGHQGDRNDWLPLVSLKTDTMLPQEWAALLDSQFGIECRAGFHCAGAIHPFLGTDSCGGTLRFSLGHTTTDHCLASLQKALETWIAVGEMKPCEPNRSRLPDPTNRNAVQVAATVGRYDWIIRPPSRSLRGRPRSIRSSTEFQSFTEYVSQVLPWKILLSGIRDFLAICLSRWPMG